MSQLLSGKVRVVKPSDVSVDRYEFLELAEVEPNLGVPISGSLSSGSIALVASDADGNRLFVTKIQLEELTGSFSGSFAGDGSQLNNLPEATRIISGSASASITPQDGFLVNVSSSFDGDMDVNGDVRITGDLLVDNRIVAREILVEIISSSIVFSSGSNRFGNDVTDLQEFTGSVSISGSYGLRGDANVTGSVFVTNDIEVNAISASFFSGSGRDLFDIPQSALSEDASLIASGAITASTADNQFRVTSIESGSLFFGDVKLDSGSVFSGSGRDLFDIPRSALTEDALLSSFIASGSVTASVSPEFGFRLEGTDRAEFSSSLFVESGVSASVFSGSGQGLFDIPRSALTEDALITNQITSGSVTASVSPDTGFVVTSVDSGSLFIGDVKLQSGSVFSGSGRDLFNIPRSALTEDALLSSFIVSGSVTASVSPNEGFVVTSLTGSTFFGELRVASGSSFSGSGEKLFDIPLAALSDETQQAINAAIAAEAKILTTGSVTASVDPNDGFIVTSEVSGSTFTGELRLTSGSDFSGSGAKLFNIPRTALTQDALISSFIASGSITASVDPNRGFRVEDFGTGILGTRSEFSGSIFVSRNATVGTDVTAGGSVSASFFSGSGRDLFDIPLSAFAEEVVASTRIQQGNVTASVSNEDGFKVESIDSGSQFTGSIDVLGGVSISSGSFFSGSGEQLFNIPRTALTDDALESNEITSGSVTASVSPNDGFVVESIDSGSTFFGEVRVQSGSAFSGSGEKLFNIPAAAIADLDTSKIFSGSVTASTSPDDGFVVTSVDSGSTFFGEVRVQSGSAFSGSGEKLFNIPRNALTEDALDSNRIISGAFSASIDPTSGFTVNASASIDGDLVVAGAIVSNELYTNYVATTIIYSSGSNQFGNDLSDRQEFTGSVFVTNSLDVDGIISGDGRGLFNIPQAALSDDSPRIATGSVSASVFEYREFQVKSSEGSVRSLFSGSIDAQNYISASLFRGDGSGLFNIPQSALSEDAFRIASGSVTASVSPNEGFIVNEFGRFEDDLRVSGSFIVSASNQIVPTGSLDTHFFVYNVGNTAYSIDGRLNPDLVLVKNLAYEFEISASGHPFYLKTSAGTGTGNALPFTNNGGTSGSIFFSASAQGTYYYNCENHAEMAGTIYVVDEYVQSASIELYNNTLIQGNLDLNGDLDVQDNISFGNTISGDKIVVNEVSGAFSGSGRDLFDIPISDNAENFPLQASIATGSVTASLTPDFRFEVNATASISGGLNVGGNVKTTGSLLVSASFEPFEDIKSLNVDVQDFDGSNKYVINSERQPTLQFLVGSTYTFWQTGSNNVTHDLRLSITSDGTHNSGNVYTGSVDTGSINAGDSGSRVIIDVDSNTPTTLYYYCINHSGMGGQINVLSEEPTNANIVFDGRVDISDNVTVEKTLKADKLIANEISGNFSGSGRNLFDIPRSAFTGDAFRIASGSVTASVTPDDGFVVESGDSGSRIIGSLQITGSVNIDTNLEIQNNLDVQGISTLQTLSAPNSNTFGSTTESLQQITGSVDTTGS